jgi:hypothetical protein
MEQAEPIKRRASAELNQHMKRQKQQLQNKKETDTTASDDSGTNIPAKATTLDVAQQAKSRNRRARGRWSKAETVDFLSVVKEFRQTTKDK